MSLKAAKHGPRVPQEKRIGKPDRQLIYKSLTEVIAQDDVTAVEELFANVHRDGFLDESFVRIGLQSSARKNQTLVLAVIVEWAHKAAFAQNDDLLRIGLQEAAKLGHEDSVRVMLERGAKTDPGKKGQPALWWSVSQPETPRHVNITRMLLVGHYPGCPANKEWKDEDGRTIFMSAAWRGHIGSLTVLLEHGVDVNARDKRGRTVLHNLAAAPQRVCRWSENVIELLLRQSVDVEALDDKRRTALHWAAATGKLKLAEQLLLRRKHPPANPNSTQSRGKTALHLSCDADPPSPAMVKLLLDSGADTKRKSDGGWSAVHYASAKGSVDVLRILLDHSPGLLNSQTSTGLFPLHIAAQQGHLDIVNCLLSFPQTKIQAKDAYHCAALLRAAGEGHLNVVERLAPYNNVDRLSPYALAACHEFEATVVDFRTGSDHQNIVSKHSVFDVLYRKESNGEHTVTTKVQNIKSRASPQFRWVHIPSNSINWVEALIAKSFVENGSFDIDGFKAVEKSFSQQHRGPKHHSHFMRPLCNRCVRGSGKGETLPIHKPSEVTRESRSRGWGERYMSSPERIGRSSGHSSGHGDSKEAFATGNTSDGKTPRSDSDKGGQATPETPARATRGAGRGRRTRPAPSGRGASKLRNGVTEPTTTKAARADSFNVSEMSYGSQAAMSMKTLASDEDSSSNVVFFMPYLHYETMRGLASTRDTVRRLEMAESGTRIRPPRSPDEKLIFAHLQSTTGLHLRRTLDQFYLHGIDTDERDADQVVGRYTRDKGDEKIFMVDQLWLFILGPELIITAFPQRWQQPRDDPLDVLDGILQSINSDMRSPISSVFDLAAVITARCSGTFDRHRPDDENFQFLDMFESSIGQVSDHETTLYSKFYKASAEVHTWLKRPDNIYREGESTSERTLSPIHHRYPPAVDQFLDIGAETSLLQEIKDIRDELNMISMVLNHQRSTLPLLGDAIHDELSVTRQGLKSRETRRKFEEQGRLVKSHISEISRMNELAGMIERSIINLLDLKQKQSNAFEARFARDQAAGTVRQGQIIMIFTLVTILFLPSSFMAAFFAIPIDRFSDLNLGYVSKYIFGIGMGISVILIAIAFSANQFGSFARSARHFFKERQRTGPAVPVVEVSRTFSNEVKSGNDYGLGMFSHEVRKSFESRSFEVGAHSRRRFSRQLSPSPVPRENSHDLERG